MGHVRVLVGTRKGAFILTSDQQRKEWSVSGPHFAGWEVSRRTFRTIDPFAPGRFRAFAAIDLKGHLQFASQDREEADAFAVKGGLTVRAVSFSPDTGEWVSL